MEKVSDTITSLFHIAIQDRRPTVCSDGDSSIAWSEPFGLGYRLGISCRQPGWFPKLCLYLDHARTQSEKSEAVVTVCLKESAEKDAKEFKQRECTIANFGHGAPASLGTWAEADLVSHPYVLITLTTKARLPPIVTNPLPSASAALRASLHTGDFVDTRFHVFSARRPRSSAGRPRVVYANSKGLGFTLPKSTTAAGRQARNNGAAPAFLVSMTTDEHMNDDAVLHEYEYEQDSDLDDEDGDLDVDVARLQRNGKSPTGSFSKTSPVSVGSTNGNREDEFFGEPPAYSVSNCQMILVKGVAYKTWLAYIYFRYTGQVSFLPLKSARGPNKPVSTSDADNHHPPRCSPKSMYRLACAVGDERLKEITCRAIKEGLSKDNIVEEAFSWFTAQYAPIFNYEVEKVSELRKLPEVSTALRLQLKAVTLGEKPWAEGVLVAILEKLNSPEPSA